MADNTTGGGVSTEGSAPAQDNPGDSLPQGQGLPNEQSSGDGNTTQPPAVEPDPGSSDAEAEAQPGASPADTLLAEAMALFNNVGQGANYIQTQGTFQPQASKPNAEGVVEFKYEPIIDPELSETLKANYPELQPLFGTLEKRLEAAERRDHERNQAIVKDRAKLDQFDAFYSEQRATQARQRLDPIIDSFGNEALYGKSDALTPAGGKMRAELVGQARILQEQAQARGINMQDNHALAMANAILTGSKSLSVGKPAAVKQVEQQVIDRSKQRRIAPGGRAANSNQTNDSAPGTALSQWIANGRPK